MVISLETNHENKQSVIQWLYIDNENRKLYEYDIFNEKLIEFY